MSVNLDRLFEEFGSLMMSVEDYSFLDGVALEDQGEDEPDSALRIVQSKANGIYQAIIESPGRWTPLEETVDNYLDGFSTLPDADNAPTPEWAGSRLLEGYRIYRTIAAAVDYSLEAIDRKIARLMQRSVTLTARRFPLQRTENQMFGIPVNREPGRYENLSERMRNDLFNSLRLNLVLPDSWLGESK